MQYIFFFPFPAVSGRWSRGRRAGAGKAHLLRAGMEACLLRQRIQKLTTQERVLFQMYPIKEGLTLSEGFTEASLPPSDNAEILRLETDGVPPKQRPGRREGRGAAAGGLRAPRSGGEASGAGSPGTRHFSSCHHHGCLWPLHGHSAQSIPAWNWLLSCSFSFCHRPPLNTSPGPAPASGQTLRWQRLPQLTPAPLRAAFTQRHPAAAECSKAGQGSGNSCPSL